MTRKGSKIDILGSPVTWAQSLLNRGQGLSEAQPTPGDTAGTEWPSLPDVGTPTPAEGTADASWEDQEDAFYSPEARPFPHSNRRSERVAKQKARDYSRTNQKDMPTRGSLKKGTKKKDRGNMSAVKRTPTKVPPATQTSAPPSQAQAASGAGPVPMAQPADHIGSMLTRMEEMSNFMKGMELSLIHI